MIAKTVPKLKGEGRGFAGLQDYIQQAHKAVHTFSGGVTSLETAAEEMQAVASRNRRAEDPLYHLILSWPEFEKPTPEQVEEAVRAQIKALGFEGHQYIAAVHNDTPDMHVHVAINQVNPETFRIHHPRGDFFTLDRTCREIELKQGWTHDRGPHVVEYVGEEAFIIEAKDRHLVRGLSEGAKALQKWSGEEPLEQFLRDSAFLEDRIIKATGWQQIHDAFRLSGLALKAEGEGLVVEHLASGTHAKASFALSLADLNARFKEPFSADIRATEQEIEQIIGELTRMNAVFAERDLDAYLVAYVEEDRRKELKEQIMQADQVVHLEAEDLNEDPPDAAKDEKAEKRPPRLMARFTTQEVLEEETAALDAASALTHRPATVISPQAVERAIASRTMRPDQLKAFQQGMAAQGIGVVQGRAGTGKSYMMTAWMEAHRDSGYRVVGLAPTNIVAQAMVADGFEEGRTVDSVLHAARKGKLDWDAQTVLVLDEAGMVSNGRMKELLEIASARGAKVLMVGDDRQLPAVERGGLFAELGKRYGAGELTVITRQKEARQREAATHFSNGAFEKGMKIYADTGRLVIKGTDAEAREALLAQWKADYAAKPSGESRFIATYANVDVDYFNDAITHHLIDQGAITDTRSIMTARGEKRLGLGSELIFTQTDRKLDVVNGERGTVTGWGDDGTMTVTCADGTTVAVNTSPEGFRGFTLGYAGTTYKSQGATIDRVYVHHTSNNRNSAAYVALTRQRQEATIFSALETAADWREIARQMSRSMVKIAASSIAPALAAHEPKPIADPNSKAKDSADLEKAQTEEASGDKPLDLQAVRKELMAEYAKERKEAEDLAKASIAGQMGALRQARDAAIIEQREGLKATRKATHQALDSLDRDAPDHADQVATLKARVAEAATATKAEIKAIRAASKAEAEALSRKAKLSQGKNNAFADWLRSHPSKKAAALVQDIDARADRRAKAEAAGKDLQIDPRQVLARHGWQVAQTLPQSVIYRHRQRPGEITVQIDAEGTGLRWFDGEQMRTGALKRLVATSLGKPLDDPMVKAETAALRAELTAQSLETKETLHAIDRRRLDATDLRQGWERGLALADVPAARDGLRIGPLTVGEWRTMPDAASYRLANVSTTGDRVPAVIAPTRDDKQDVKGFSLSTAIGHFSPQGQKPMLTVLGKPEAAERIIVAFDFHTAASQWKDLAPEDQDKTALILSTGSKRTLRALKATLEASAPGAELVIAQPKAKALEGAMEGAKAVVAARVEQTIPQRIEAIRQKAREAGRKGDAEKAKALWRVRRALENGNKATVEMMKQGKPLAAVVPRVSMGMVLG